MKYTERNTASIDKHFNEVNKHPIFSIEEQDQLAELAQGGDEEARTKLINSNLRLAISLAKRYKVTGIEIEDLISSANESIVKSITSYKVGNNFPNWAHSHIKRDLIQYISRYRFAIKCTNHQQKQNRDPIYLKSFESIMPGYEETFEDFLPGSTEQEEEEEREDYNENLVEVLKNNIKKLSPKQQQVIEMHFFKGLSHNKIAQELGLSHQAIDARMKKSLKKMKDFLTKD